MSFRDTKTPTKPTAKAKWQVPMRPHPTQGVPEYYMEGELKERFCRLFPKNSNRRLMLWFGISFSTLHRFRTKFGLEKDMRAIRKQHAKDVKKTCEKNGYYDSIRGRVPSEACREAARKKREEGFHPMKQLKAENPQRYKRLLKKRSEHRKELFRKERLRQDYGLARKTHLRIPISNLSRKASSHKYMMIHQCGYMADPLGDPRVIRYNDDTRRSERREATAVRHGLKVFEAEKQETTETEQ